MTLIENLVKMMREWFWTELLEILGNGGHIKPSSDTMLKSIKYKCNITLEGNDTDIIS